MCTGSVAVGKVSTLGPLLSMTYLTVLSIRTLGGNWRFDVGSDNVRRSCQKIPSAWSSLRWHHGHTGHLRFEAASCQKDSIAWPRCAAIGDVVEDSLVCRSVAKDSKDKRLTRRRCSSWSLHHEGLHQLLVGVAAVVRGRRLPLLRCAGLPLVAKPLLVFSSMMMPRPVDPATRCPIVPAADLPS